MDIDFDIRPFYVAFCFTNVTLCASLFVFILMEWFGHRSFIALLDELAIFAGVSVLSVGCVMVLSIVSVVSVWIRNRKLLRFSNSVSCLFVIVMGFILYWVGSAQRGDYNPDFRDQGFVPFHNTTTNRTCLEIPSLECCGWAIHCDSSCTIFNTTCHEQLQSSIHDFAVRVIPLVSTVMVCQIGSLLIGWTSKQWKLNAKALTAPQGNTAGKAGGNVEGVGALAPACGYD